MFADLCSLFSPSSLPSNVHSTVETRPTSLLTLQYACLHAPFTNLQYQKKQEMISIANSLGLKVDPATNTRDALEDVITKELRTRRNELETHPLYEKLYDSLDRDAKKEK
jgi:hypothetical protein